MTNISIASLLDAMRQHGLLDSKQLEELSQLQSRFADPIALARELIRRGWLTLYQAKRLLQGQGHKLVLGSYILLELVGEGGMGRVFKARHRHLRRVAAIKLIRKDRLNNPSIIKRFEREVRAAAALDHPNIVLAYDADKINGTHMLVMEYVESATDLARLVADMHRIRLTRAVTRWLAAASRYAIGAGQPGNRCGEFKKRSVRESEKTANASDWNKRRGLTHGPAERRQQSQPGGNLPLTPTDRLPARNMKIAPVSLSPTPAAWSDFRRLEEAVFGGLRWSAGALAF